MTRTSNRRLTWTLFGLVLTSVGLEGCIFSGCPGPIFERTVFPVAKELDDFELAKMCEENCNGSEQKCERARTETGLPAFVCSGRVTEGCISGRRPRGHRTRGMNAQGSRVASMLSGRARLEAASVVAFDDLARELAAWGAPRRLIARAERAARDEERHATVVSALAVARGGRGARVVRRRTTRAPRSLAAIAFENAREGCVFETYAALMARVESESATDVAFRAEMVAIAKEEARHADLARAVDAWIRPRLSPRNQARLDRVHRTAFRELASSIHEPALPTLGVPGAERKRQLVAALEAALLR